MLEHKETIAAISTPTGRAGIGAIRVSGKNSKKIYQALTGSKPEHKRAQYVSFVSSSSEIIDKGVSLFFKGPSSYTGEDVMECFTHGSRFILDALLQEIIVLGARPASPGEFTQRAFLNGKIDLIQAEAVADLIDSNSKIAARSALQSMQGVFSDKIFALKAKIIETRALIEAMLDFPDEEGTEIDAVPAINNIKWCINSINQLLAKTKTGRMLNKAPTIAIVGKPNAGKSTYISKVSNAKPKIKDYPFTTLTPNLGIVKYGQYKTFVIADIPGIIEGASDGKGLGIQFLKHIERTRILAFMIEATSDDILADYKLLRQELQEYDPKLNDKKSILFISKIDIVNNSTEEIENIPKDIDIEFISSVTGKNIESSISKLSHLL